MLCAAVELRLVARGDHQIDALSERMRDCEANPLVTPVMIARFA
jgi:hypothetical protein